MQLKVLRSLWGTDESIPVEKRLEQVAAAGFDGVDGFPAEGYAPAEYRKLVESFGLELLVGGIAERTEELETILGGLAEYEPLRIGLMGGLDAMSREEGEAFFEEALRIEESIGIPVAHETHRGRILFSPWDAAYYLKRFPELKVLADFSHWVNVCERLPDDQETHLALARRHTVHVHGRVGYAEGPQVPDPAAPEYADELAWHEGQWKAIWEMREAAGDEMFTFTPEYGPPPYLHTLPHSNEPVADLWEICVWTMQRAREVLG
ncbi:MAG: hypothetical protein DWQ07_10490 [Chloroflexi bacterium]|nr:MAG: hypothetical protein DWQ07_10490 [Chloroflexota bacterium]MBL1192860.1 hypothetical protein [Chloroflexota bacterium]NOH10153.1 hypothetical protein [Chloroflexota bacterium]